MPFHDSTPPSVAFGGSIHAGPAPHPTFDLVKSEPQPVSIYRRLPTRYRIVVRYKKRHLPQLRHWSAKTVVAGVAAGIILLTGLAQYDAAQKWEEEVRFLNNSSIFSSSAPTAFRAEMASEAIAKLDQPRFGFRVNETTKMQAGSLYRKAAELQGYGRVANRGDINSALVGLRKSVSLLEQAPENTARRELGISLQRMANVLSQAGQLDEARSTAQRAISLLSARQSAGAGYYLLVAFTELSSIEQRMGLKQDALISARKAVNLAGSVSSSEGAAKAQAYERLALALNAVNGPKPEAVEASNAALQVCRDSDRLLESCQAEYFAALDTAGQLQALAGRHGDALKLYEQAEPRLKELASQDPNNHFLLEELRRAQQNWGVSLQALNRVDDALVKFEQAMKTAGVISASAGSNKASACPLLEARLSYAALLVQHTSRVAEGQLMWTEAKELLNSTGAACSGIQQPETPPAAPREPRILRAKFEATE